MKYDERKGNNWLVNSIKYLENENEWHTLKIQDSQDVKHPPQTLRETKYERKEIWNKSKEEKGMKYEIRREKMK